ncbi:MAG: hypothetical protein COS15_02065 [Caldiserica bacterium CG02_land_8_20_14_3_00_36_38]|nr:hypothetical protein [Caldisericota bacterium]OIP13969.1 MAG: hypothetical protein AUJ99_00540 [Caldisericum sp. CG2_30_36_11]PIP50020.1 MAG: hypothetical protein COX13_00675 [Caldiserica bacterium CG23_combo_of_CG06-09_8_20_14_all_35_60]PIV56216.1 MAG: hypothetical protein COS15_02065 [Caldiserica bacterium CG02_land_8_20_14_3_00_36_38]PIX29424.1 MAG: hypothetical protein COZ65_02380 [Caldiserica bacterium CG_4_8_14_3_um_filter_35_18]
MKRKIFLFVMAIFLTFLGAYLYEKLKNNPQFSNEIQCEVVYWESGDLDIGRFLSKNIYVKNFKNDESSFEYIEKYAKESLPIKDPELDVGEIIFFNDKEAATAIQAVAKIDKNSSAGFTLSFNYPDKPERIKKFKQSIVAIYFRLPNKDPKFIRFPQPVFENLFEN